MSSQEPESTHKQREAAFSAPRQPLASRGPQLHEIGKLGPAQEHTPRPLPGNRLPREPGSAGRETRQSTQLLRSERGAEWASVIPCSGHGALRPPPRLRFYSNFDLLAERPGTDHSHPHHRPELEKFYRPGPGAEEFSGFAERGRCGARRVLSPHLAAPTAPGCWTRSPPLRSAGPLGSAKNWPGGGATHPSPNPSMPTAASHGEPLFATSLQIKPKAALLLPRMSAALFSFLQTTLRLQ